MRRIMLTVSYDGTRFHGYQIQDNVQTIEGELTRAIKEVTGEEVTLIGGSRTDAGVHALCNIAVFDTESRIAADRFCYALNAHLPEDIRVVKSEEKDISFHPRHCDSQKTYEYKIYNSKFENPLKRNFSHFSYSKFDIELMKEACKYFIGEHDFTSFCTVGAQVDSKVRTIYSLEVITEDDNYSITDEGYIDGHRDIVIKVTGNGFLYNMVRIIAGTLMEVGVGRIAPNDIANIIEAKNREKAGPTAPAKGLRLAEYKFI